MDMKQFEKLSAEADRRMGMLGVIDEPMIVKNYTNYLRSKGFVVIDIATAKLLQLQVKSGAFCNPKKSELDRIDSEIAKTQSAMKAR